MSSCGTRLHRGSILVAIVHNTILIVQELWRETREEHHPTIPEQSILKEFLCEISHFSEPNSQSD